MARKCRGALYFFDDSPEIIGHLRIGRNAYQIVGVKTSPIKADIEAHKSGEYHDDGQIDIFDGGNDAAG